MIMNDQAKILLFHAKKLAESCEAISCRECPFMDEHAGGPAFCALHDHTPVSWLPVIHQIQEGGKHGQD